MSLTSFNGGESSVWDSGSGAIRDGEGATGTTDVATVAGALRPGSTGSRHQLMDFYLSGKTGINAVVTTRVVANNGAGATTIATHLVAQIDNVTGDGTTYDDIFITDSAASHFFVCYARKADGKLHLLVDLEAVSAVANNGSGKARFTLTNSTTGWTTGDTIFSEVTGYRGFTTITVIDGTHVDTTFAFVATGTGNTYWEVNPANAFTPAFGSAFGLRIEIGVSAPYLAEMYYDSTAGGTFVKQQSANAPKSISVFANLKLGKNIGKGNIAHNWKFSCDDVYVQDNGGSFNNTLVREYRDVVMARRPAAGTQQYNETGFQNTSSVTCNSTACYTDVADTNDGTYVKFVGDPGHVGGLQFYHITFPTIGSVPQVNDTVYAALVSARGIDKSASAPGYGGWWYYNGTGAILAGYTAGPTTVGWTACSGDDHAPDGTAWTPAAIAQTQIGVAPAVADTATYNLQYTELYFTLLYKQAPVGKIVRVKHAAPPKGRGLHLISLAPPTSVTPVTPNRRRWVWVS